MLKTRLLPALALFAAACAAPQAQTPDTTETAAPMAASSELPLERLYASPSLSGPTPQGVKYSPDGKRVTFLKARADEGERYDLWQFDVATGEQSMLVDSKLLEPEEVELSEEEKALRERKRIAGRKGIVSYDWGTADTILVPLGGDLHLVTLPSADGPEFELEIYESTISDLGFSEEKIRRKFEEALLALNGARPDPADLENLVIATIGDEVFSLSDLAKIVPAQREPEARQLTATDAFEYDAKVSPGGRYVSFVRDGAVYAIDLTTNEETRLTPLAEPEKAISYGVAEFVAQEEMSRYTGYWWSPDDCYLAYTRVDESTVDILPRFDIAAEEVTVIEQRYPRAGRPNAIVDLFVRDLETGEVVEIDWRREDWGPATDQYLARVNFHQRGNLMIQAVNREQTKLFYGTCFVSNGCETLTYAGQEEQENWINLSNDFRSHSEKSF
ncbi:MAG: DPP IV N-terminal domain-containing protein, partial [Pseudomonadota bacterium]